MNMNSKFVIIVMSIVLAISVAFSCFLIFSLKEAKANGGVVDNSGSNNLGNTTTTDGNGGEEENPDDSGDGSGSSSSRNEKAPDFTFCDLQGNEVKLSDYFGQGKPIVLNFWATWCGQCKEEMPDFDDVYKQYQDKVIFLMVNATTTSSETPEKAMAYISSNTDFSLPFFLDIYGDAKEKYGLSSLPYTFFIDEEGYILARGNHKYSKTNLISTIENRLLGN